MHKFGVFNIRSLSRVTRVCCQSDCPWKVTVALYSASCKRVPRFIVLLAHADLISNLFSLDDIMYVLFYFFPWALPSLWTP